MSHIHEMSSIELVSCIFRQVDAADRWTWAQERHIAESVGAVVLPVSVRLGMLRQRETSSKQVQKNLFDAFGGGLMLGMDRKWARRGVWLEASAPQCFRLSHSQNRPQKH